MEHEKICRFINEELHRGATVSDSNGAYTNSEKKMILTVLGRGEAVKLKDYVKTVDEHAFVIILNSTDIVGKGFRTSIN